MYIKKIELENIKRYEKAEINFSSGLNFISGKNGAGKTTIIESIGYALFGFQNANKGFAAYIIRKGEKKGKIRVTFLDKDNNELIADRKISISNAGNSWSIRKIENGEEIEIVSGTEEIPAYLRDHLEFYPDDNITQIYEKIISVPQGQMTAAFFFSDKNRKEEFDPLFKLDTYRKTFERIKLVRDIENENIEIDKTVARYEGNLAQEESTMNEKKVKEEEKKKLDEELKDFEENEKKVKDKYEKVEKLKKDLDLQENSLKLKMAEKKGLDEIYQMNEKNLKDANDALEILKNNEENYKKYLELEKILTEKELELKKIEPIILEVQKNNERITNGTTKVTERNEMLKKSEEDIKKLKIAIEEEKKKELEISKTLSEKNNKEIKNSKEENNDDKSKDILLEIKKASERIIELEISINEIKKNLKDALMQTNMPSKEILYLNKANVNMEIIIENVDSNYKGIAKETKENIEKAIEISKSASNETKKDANLLVSEKDEKEKEILNIINKYVKDDSLLELISDGDTSKARMIINKYITNLENAKSEENSEIAKLDAQLKSLKSLIEKYTQDLTAKEENYKKETLEKDKWIAAIKDLEKKVLDAKDTVSLNEKLKVEIEDIKKVKESLKDVYELYVRNLEKRKQAEEFGKIKIETDEKIKKCITELEEINKSLEEKKNNFDVETYTKLKEEYDKTKAGSKVLLERLKNINNDLEKINQMINSFKMIKKEIKNCMVTKKENLEAIEILKKLRKVINEAPEVIANLLIKNISNRASSIYADIASDTNRLEWENSYELALYDYINGNEVKKEFKQLSGGEQMSAALSVRMAMLELLTRLKIVILDEPTTNIDTLRRERLAEIVGKISENFNQLFVVSHDDTFENITQNVVMLSGGGEGE